MSCSPGMLREHRHRSGVGRLSPRIHRSSNFEAPGAASLSTFGQHSGDYVSRVKQDCPVLFVRELDEPQSPEQEHPFDSQQGMTNFLGGARFGQVRIEQRAVVAPRWLHHVGGVHQSG